MTKRSMHFRSLMAHLNVVASLLFASKMTLSQDSVTELQWYVGCLLRKDNLSCPHCCSRGRFRKCCCIREVLINQDNGGRVGKERWQVAGVQEVVSLYPRCGVRGNVHEGPFLSLFVRDPCSFTHATRRLCHGKPRSLGVLLWSTGSTEAGTGPSRKVRLRALKVRAGQVTSSPRRI